MENGIFAHKAHINCEVSKLINDYLLEVPGVILSEELEKEAECYYFAMCLLMPEESLINIVNGYGGYEDVLNSKKYLTIISNIFGVPYEILRTRILMLYREECKKSAKEIKLDRISKLVDSLYRDGNSREDIVRIINRDIDKAEVKYGNTLKKQRN